MLRKSEEEIKAIGNEIEIEHFPEEPCFFSISDPRLGDILGFKTENDVFGEILTELLFSLEELGIKHRQAHEFQECLLATSVLISSTKEENFLEALKHILDNSIEIQYDVIWPLAGTADKNNFENFEIYEINSEKREKMWEEEHFHLNGAHINVDEDSHSKFVDFYDRFTFVKFSSETENLMKTAEYLLRNSELAETYIENQESGTLQQLYEEKDEIKVFSAIDMKIGELAGKKIISDIKKEINRVNSLAKLVDAHQLLIDESQNTPFPVIYHEEEQDDLYDEFIMNFETRIPEVVNTPKLNSAKTQKAEELYFEIFRSKEATTYENKLQKCLELRKNLDPDSKQENFIYLATILEILLSKNADPSFSKIAKRASSLLSETGDSEKPLTETKGLLSKFFNTRNKIVHEGENIPIEGQNMSETMDLMTSTREITDTLILYLAEFSSEIEPDYSKLLKKLDLKYKKAEIEVGNIEDVLEP